VKRKVSVFFCRISDGTGVSSPRNIFFSASVCSSNLLTPAQSPKILLCRPSPSGGPVYLTPAQSPKILLCRPSPSGGPV